MAGVVWSLTRKCFITCSLICFSNGFDKIGSIEMGLKFEGSDLSPYLRRGITFASLNTWGKVFLSIQRLYIYVRVSAIKCAERRSIFPSKPSVPFVFDCFK